MQFRWFMTACVLMVVAVCPSYAALVYSTETGVALNQEYTDGLNGLVPTSSGSPIEGSISYLTDATSSTDPAGHLILQDNIMNHYLTWDVSSLGSALDLRSISIWVAGGDENRNHINAIIRACSNGEWQTVADYQGFDPSAVANYNHALWQWDAGDVPNVTAVQVIMGWGPCGQHARLVEIDGNFVNVPEPMTIGLLAMGSLMLRRRK